MDTKTVLEELGLSEGETKVYLALLKLGSCPVSDIKTETKLHRTTIYDFLEKLINKSLVSYVIKNNTNYYKATHPEKLMEVLKEKEDNLKQVLPELVKLSEFKKEEMRVEVYRGREGYKTILNLIHKTGKDLVGFGFEEEYFEKFDPLLVRQHFIKLKELGIHESVIAREGSKFLYEHPNVHYRFMQEEYFNPNPTMTFGDYVVMLVWEPLSFVVVENHGLADAYRKYFQILWGQEVKTYKGNKGAKLVFDNILDSLKDGDEYLLFGASRYSEHFIKYFSYFNKKLREQKVRCKNIFDEQAKKQIEQCRRERHQVRVLPKDFITPAEVNIYKDKTAIIVWTKEPISFIIDNKEFTESFRKYFELLWKTAKPTY